jgi:CheY-like chemotaxis protein
MCSKKRILLVDDNPVNIAILEEILGDDYRIETSLNGRDALKTASAFQPHIILLDVMMPDMDGLETCRRLRSLAESSDPIIVMLSAKAMPSERAAGLTAGADDYITKPFDEVEILTVLRSYFDPVKTCESTRGPTDDSAASALARPLS